jgi:pantothenate kinase type III
LTNSVRSTTWAFKEASTVSLRWRISSGVKVQLKPVVAPWVPVEQHASLDVRSVAMPHEQAIKAVIPSVLIIRPNIVFSKAGTAPVAFVPGHAP